MRWLPNVFLGLGIAVAGCAGVFWLVHSPPEGPPALPAHAGTSAVASEQRFPPIDTLLPPWFAPVPLAAPLVARLAPAPSKPVDRTSVAYLGSYSNAAGVPTYFFKFSPTKQYLLLALDQSANGWKLTGVSQNQFSLEGPGGLYEVSR